MLKYREQPYRVQDVGNGGMKIKIPAKWANIHGWEKGDLIYVASGESAMILTKQPLKIGGAVVGRYTIAKDYTVLVPTAIKDGMELKKGDELVVYLEQEKLIYKREANEKES